MNGPTQKTPTIPFRGVPENLEAGAATFRERDKQYGPSYLRFGGIMDELFPNGLKIEPRDAPAYVRLGVFVQIVSKIMRYAESLTKGGHQDSAHDIMVYGAMLEQVTETPNQSAADAKAQATHDRL